MPGEIRSRSEATTHDEPSTPAEWRRPLSCSEGPDERRDDPRSGVAGRLRRSVSTVRAGLRGRGRGQAHTLEAIIAALLLFTSVLFALQVTAVTPLSASTSNQHIENQQQALAEGLLNSAAESGALREAVLYWGNEDGDQPEFHCARQGESYGSDAKVDNPSGPDPCTLSAGDPYADGTPPNEFGAMLGDTFGTGVAVNVLVEHRTPSGDTETQPMVFRGEPTDNAVAATTTVILFDDDELRDSTGAPTGVTVSSGAAGFYAEDAYTSSELFNVLRVEVVVWRI